MSLLPKTSDSTKLNFFARLTGVNASIYQRASPTFRHQLTIIGVGMLFTASFSGTLLALSVYYFYHSLLAAALAFAVSFWFTILIDRKLVSATVPLGFLGRFSRLLLILAWVILHATMIETAVFTDDLQTYLHTQQAPEVAAITDTYQTSRQELQTKRDSIEATIAHSTARIRNAYEAAKLEAQGLGATGVAGVGDMTNYLTGLANQSVAQEEAYITKQQNELALLESRWQAAKAEKEAQLAALPHITEFGPLQRAELLHEMIWGKGHSSLQAMALVIILLISTVELLPLIGKGLADFEEYYTLHRLDKTRTIARDQLRGRMQQEVQAVEEARKAQLEKVRIREHYRRQELVLRLNEIVQRFQRTVAAIEALNEEEVAAQRGKTAYTETRLAEASAHALEEMEALIPEY